jgi:magnesium chelatase family protein
MNSMINLDGCNVSAGLLEACLNAMAKGRPMLLVGPAGAGKTMLARRLGAVRGAPYAPFRAPHHTVSVAGMAGSTRYPMGGECARANGGTLFLDELPEFPRHTLDVIRAAYQDKQVTHHDRKEGTHLGVSCDFYLIGASNACPCGWLGTSRKCECSGGSRVRYQERISGFVNAVDFVRIGVESVDLDNGTRGMVRAPKHESPL